jgi:hypothetical protein
MRELIRGSLRPLRNVKLVALHLVGNAALVIGAALWLLVPDERAWQLAATAIAGLIIVFLFSWMHSGTLAWSADAAGGFRRGLRHLLAFIVFAGVLYLAMRVVAGMSDSSWPIANYLYSKLPNALRPTRGPVIIEECVGAAIGVLVWYVIPALLLPFVAAAAQYGFSARLSRAAARVFGRLRYWVLFAIICGIGVLVPKLLLGWTPGTGVGGQTISLAIRLTLAYVIAVAAWLMTCGLLGSLSRVGAATAVENAGGKTAPQPA